MSPRPQLELFIIEVLNVSDDLKIGDLDCDLQSQTGLQTLKIEPFQISPSNLNSSLII